VQYQGAKLAWNGRRLALPIHVGEKEKGRLAVTTARIGLHVLTGSATDLDSVSEALCRIAEMIFGQMDSDIR
jgi:hypothetical protein